MTKRKIEEEIELTFTDSDGNNFPIFLENSGIGELRNECRKCLENLNEDDNFECDLFYKNLDDVSIKYQLRNDKDLKNMLRHYQRRNAMNKIRIFTEGRVSIPTKMKKIGVISTEELVDKFQQKTQGFIFEEDDLQQQQSSSCSSGNFNDKLKLRNRGNVNNSKITNADLKSDKMEGKCKNERRKNDFIDATEKHPYLLFFKCPSTTMLPAFSLKCQNELHETFEMKRFVDDDDDDRRKVEEKILWIERYFLDTSNHCLKDSPSTQQNLNITVNGGENIYIIDNNKNVGSQN